MSREEVQSDLQIPWKDEGNRDMVEAVRCKDCKYSSPNTVYGCRIEPFSYLDDGVRMYSDDYCSRGERRDV